MKLRIHGDNIVECERALRLLAAALGTNKPLEPRLLVSPLWAPKYALGDSDVEIQLFPGYGRWPLDIQSELRRRGAPLRENSDAVVTVLRGHLDSPTEEPLMAFEFCGALPAGNQAWQRCGRSLNPAYCKIPYFYFAELGGAELDASRQRKAGRLPNPLIPFAYLAMGDDLATVALPVFEPSPSIEDDARKMFGPTFGMSDALILVSSIVNGGYRAGKERDLREKAIRATAVLTQLRRRRDTLSSAEWEELARQRSGRDKANWLVARRMPWRKTVTIPVTETFRNLLSSAQSMSVGIGTEELPVCLVPGKNRQRLAQLLGELYGAKVGRDFQEWLRKDKPLGIVWLAGFKPDGEDSRPDRGLVPLARMIFGETDVDILSVVYGPGRNLRQVMSNLTEAANTNGLWEAILRFSNAVLIDSLTGAALNPISVLVPERVQARPTVVAGTPAGSEIPLEFGENDVDSALHLIFAQALCSSCFECMCNPPGGDWSGISLRVNGYALRWTSLPRVTAEGSKRPDHVVQFDGPNPALLAIESKNDAAAVETGIGPRLVQYVSSLLTHAPNITRKISDVAWNPAINAKRVVSPPVISAAAFHYHRESELAEVDRRAGCHLTLGFEFDRANGRTIVHAKGHRKLDWLFRFLDRAARDFNGRLIVEIN
jgi:hypothetical protein